MMASSSTVITMGYGNGTLAGTPSLVLTLGYGIGAPADQTFGRMEFTIPANQLSFTIPANRLDYTVQKP